MSILMFSGSSIPIVSLRTAEDLEKSLGPLFPCTLKSCNRAYTVALNSQWGKYNVGLHGSELTHFPTPSANSVSRRSRPSINIISLIRR